MTHVATLSMSRKFEIPEDAVDPFGQKEMEQERLKDAICRIWSDATVKASATNGGISSSLENELSFEASQLCLKHINCMSVLSYEKWMEGEGGMLLSLAEARTHLFVVAFQNTRGGDMTHSLG